MKKIEKLTLNKRDQWLIAHWYKIHQLENALNLTRENYIKVFNKIHSAVKQSHPELNRLETQLSPRIIRDYGGQVAFSNTKWLYTYEDWPTGIYIWGISLDELSGEKDIEPAISIWIGTRGDRVNKKVEALRNRLAQKAGRIFRGKNIQWRASDEEDARNCLSYTLPGGRVKLLELLLKKSGDGFVEYMVNHVNLMARFIPVIEEVCAK